MLEARKVSKIYEGTGGLKEVDFQVGLGETVGIIGPNGSGKSTLLKLLSREITPDCGEVYLEGIPLSNIPAKKRATKIAVLNQEEMGEVPFIVEELVQMGRYPYQTHWFGWQKDDQEVVNQSLQVTKTAPFRNRFLNTLSGGERQRVAIAKAYAQEPDYLLLDEPTTFLDLHYQWYLLRILQEWRQTHRKTLIVVLHDLNLAALFCDRLYLFQSGNVLAHGTPQEVLTKERIEGVYRIQAEVIVHPKYGVPQILFA